MGKKNANSRRVHANGTKQPYSNQEILRFFNQKPITPAAKQIQEGQQAVQKIKLETTTDILLVAILEELKTRNRIELMKLKSKQDQEQKELQAAKKMQEHDQARFEEIRPFMYL
ncbi:hypothetical protein [Legionella clemsonensis]|uniref:Coiled-coil protein n=1 Tax=Legionella clemsonensis TaxID=1867846 RepID=A0A222P5H1_9GAMM|nr:hypothetical protein [Legionella clemsonensis]ASQ47088.1 hypothetical protein clem_12770 [Legionella clemsonensis]